MIYYNSDILNEIIVSKKWMKGIDFILNISMMIHHIIYSLSFTCNIIAIKVGGQCILIFNWLNEYMDSKIKCYFLSNEGKWTLELSDSK